MKKIFLFLILIVPVTAFGQWGQNDGGVTGLTSDGSTISASLPFTSTSQFSLARATLDSIKFMFGTDFIDIEDNNSSIYKLAADGHITQSVSANDKGWILDRGGRYGVKALVGSVNGNGQFKVGQGVNLDHTILNGELNVDSYINGLGTGTGGFAIGTTSTTGWFTVDGQADGTNLASFIADKDGAAGDSSLVVDSRGFLLSSTTAGITASVTQTQGQQPLTATINEISTIANNDDVVTLPAAAAGMMISIINNGANTLQIFPASGDDLGNGVDASDGLEANESVIFAAYDATNWSVEASTQAFHAEMEDTDNTDAYVVSAATNVEAYHSNGVVVGDIVGWTFDAGGGGTSFPIASIADAGGGDITVTTTGSHTLEVGAIVSHANLTDAAYEGVFVVLTVPGATTYTVTAVFTATDTGTMQEAATLTCQAIADGRYLVNWSASTTTATNNESFDFELYKNATALSGGLKVRRKHGTAADFGSTSGVGIVAIASGDKISFTVENQDSAGNITIRNLGVVVTRL